MMHNLSDSLRRFRRDQRGTVAVNRLFMVGAALAIGLTVITMMAFGSGEPTPPPPTTLEQAEAAFREAHMGRDRATVLAEGPRDYFSPSEMRARYVAYVDPGQTDDEALRSAHRTWVRRAAYHAYSQPGRARDMVILLEHALAARGLEPHPDA